MARRLFAPVFASALLCAGLAAAQVFQPSDQAGPAQREIPQTRAQITQSFAPLVKRANPAVVNVYGARREKISNPLMDDPFFRELFGGRRGAPQERMERSVGSGVLVGEDGIVVTNHHVIEGMTEIKVSLSDKREFEADVLLRDPKTDLAILRVKGGGKFPTLPFGVGQTVTQGIISALARTHIDAGDYQFFIQTDAAINPGNSGGALIDMQGRLVGINSAIYSKSGGSHGIGFAIPTNMVRVVMNSAQAGGKQVTRPWYGARMQNVTADIAESIGLPRPAGALIASVVPDSPAAVSGLKPGDVITAVDGMDIDDPDSFGFRFATKSVGGNATISIMRNGRKLALPTRLIAAPETPPRETVKIAGRSPLVGITAMNVSPAVTDQLSLTGISEGVVVAEVADNTPAADVGFQKGDVLLSINGAKITSTKVLEEQTRARALNWRVSINRGGQVVSTVIGG